MKQDGPVDQPSRSQPLRFPNASLILTATADSLFTEANAGLTGVARSFSSIADADGDGNPDLLITGSNAATLYLGDGQGGFTEAGAGLTDVSFSSISIADIDGDTDPNLLITGRSAASQSLSCMRIFSTTRSRSRWLASRPLPTEKRSASPGRRRRGRATRASVSSATF